MSQIFLIIVVVLFFLAIADLIVGVSNDAVNFLNSAIGSRAAKLSTIMVVAIAGILTGVLFSNGMMGIARTGIFFPSMYYFNEVMYIFLAVVISDVILIDTFSSFGLPTSTTVSIIFELLGASVAVALFKTLAESGNIDALGSYINTGKALAIISGILLSVVIAFTVGAIVQYLSRILFTFQFKDKIRFLGGLWGGFAVTAIIYFMVIKGARGASFMNPALLAYIETNTIWILSISLVGWSLFFQLLIWLFNTNVLKITVLLGTFALAMAFAGNDLVNFIGVPLAGFESFRIFLANQGVQPDNLLMGDLMNPIKTPTYILLIAGGIMSVTLVFSKKAKTVISTSVDLSRQDEGSEKFPSF
ncbi:MAG: phosphate permease, partial [Bacteroidetes bacterium HGW-Bacteroidetes-22]